MPDAPLPPARRWASVDLDTGEWILHGVTEMEADARTAEERRVGRDAATIRLKADGTPKFFDEPEESV